ncbi:MAG: hypothetical protein P1U42_00815 [Phycisphaerales bacterium]|nr:hypothetical protein [Phycisphaerales bacterium]
MSKSVYKLTDKDLRDWLFASQLNPTDRHTMLTLAHGIIRSDYSVRLDYKTIAQWLGITTRAAKYRIKNIESKGLLIPTRSGGGRDIHGRGYSNEWRFDFEALKVMSDYQPKNLPGDENDANSCTLKDETEQHHRVKSSVGKVATEQQLGCNPTTDRVQPIAHNPMIPMEPMTTNEGTNKARLHDEGMASFESWWKSYPSRPGCPKGNKSEAFESWQKLTIEQHTVVVRATTNLIQSKAYPKDAQRFLRPERGSKKTDPVYQAWVKVEPSKMKSSNTESAKHDEDDSWIVGSTQ